jgi:prepilin-type N-terminal cleavage/methylation domain-containing protein/prepilin-type processing-associated H-X9-DG protein
MKRTKGFTLIELLVVISIIALLLSILTPALRKAKEHAMSIICKNNLSQYNLGMGMYLHEADDEYPRAWDCLYGSFKDPDTKTGWCQWHDAKHSLDLYPENGGPLYDYLGGGKIHHCPYFTRAAKTVGWRHPSENAEHNNIGFEVQFSYSMNAYLSNTKKTKIQKSLSRVFLFAEENPWRSQPKSMDPLNNPYDYDQDYSHYVLNDNSLLVGTAPNSNPIDCFASFHSAPSGNYAKGFSNVLFADGHVDYASPADSYRYAWPKLTPQ